MPKLLLTFLITTLSISCFGQNMANSLGLITLDENYSGDTPEIEILNEDNSIWWKVVFDDNFQPPQSPIELIAFHPDYFLFKAKCVAEDPNYYTISVKESTGTVKRIRKSKVVKLITWEEHVLNVFSIGFDKEDNPILKQIDGEKSTATGLKPSRYQPIKLQGEWMQIKWDTTNTESKNEDDYVYGWIRWKKDDELIIYIYSFA